MRVHVRGPGSQRSVPERTRESHVPLRRDGSRAADCVRERRQPAAGACREPASGDDRQAGARRQSSPTDSAAAVGEPACWRRQARRPAWHSPRGQTTRCRGCSRTMWSSRRRSTSAPWHSPPDSPRSPRSCSASVTRCARRASARCPGSRTTARAGGQRALMARTLIGVQIAASLVLLVVAGLFVRTLYNYSQVDVGFDVRNLLVFQIDPRSSASDPGSVGRCLRTRGRVPSRRCLACGPPHCRLCPSSRAASGPRRSRPRRAGHGTRRSTFSQSGGTSSRRSACRSSPAGASRQPTPAEPRAWR